MSCTMKSCCRASQLILVLLGLVFSASSASAQSSTTTQSTSTFLSGNQKISLSRFEPRAEGKHPTIVLVHGLQSVESSKDALDTICQRYAARGYAVFLIHYFDRTKTTEKDIERLLAKFKNFIANDQKPRDEATGQIFAAWLDTLRDGLTHIRELPNVDRKRIALVGLSLGSFMSLTLAAEEDQQIAAVASFFGGMPRDVAARVKNLPPVQVIHGGKDLVVPVSEAHALKKLADDKKFQLKLELFPNSGHMFVGPKGVFQFLDAYRANDLTSRFLDEHLKQVR